MDKETVKYLIKKKKEKKANAIKAFERRCAARKKARNEIVDKLLK